MFTNKVTGLWLTWKDSSRRRWPAMLRGTGARLGARHAARRRRAARPRSPPTRSRRRSPRTRRSFGKGAIEGVAGPESGNNAGAQTSFIPLLTLGIPPNAVMALMVGAMTIHNIQPGPQVMTSNPQLFWGLIASDVDRQPDAGGAQPAADRHLGQAAAGALPAALPGDPAVLLHRRLQPATTTIFDVHDDRRCSALLGWIFVKLECEPAPLLLGFVLGPMMEENLRRALLLSRGDPTVFFTRPLSRGAARSPRPCCCCSSSLPQPAQEARGSVPGRLTRAERRDGPRCAIRLEPALPVAPAAGPRAQRRRHVAAARRAGGHRDARSAAATPSTPRSPPRSR